MTLGNRIALLVAITSALVSAVVGTASFLALKAGTDITIDRQLQAIMERVSVSVGSSARFDDAACNELRSSTQNVAGDGVQIVVVQGLTRCVLDLSEPSLETSVIQRIASSFEERRSRLTPLVQGPNERMPPGVGMDRSMASGEPLRVRVARLQRDAVIIATRDRSLEDASLSRARNLITVLVAVGVLLSGLLGMLVTHHGLRQYRKTMRVISDAIEDTTLEMRVPEPSDPELAQHVRAANRLLDNLASSIDAQRELVVDAAHELRTPLTSVQANIGVLKHTPGDHPERAAMLDDVSEQIRELSLMVDGLVELARSRQHHLDDPVPVDLAEEVRAVTERAYTLYPGIAITVSGVGGGVTGDPGLIRRALMNLVDNSVKFGASSVSIECRGGAICVEDDGPGIPDNQLIRIFEPFHRAPGARSPPGSGLGLALVRRVAELHGGRVTARNRAGGGASILLELAQGGVSDADPKKFPRLGSDNSKHAPA